MIGSRTLTAGLLTVGLLGLAGCQDEGDPAPAASESAATPTQQPEQPEQSGSTQPTEATPEPSDASAPAVSPATGPELVLETSSVHAPQGWVKEDSIAAYEASASRPGGGGLITLLDTDGLGGEVSLDDIYRVTVQTLPPDAKTSRQPDAMLGEEQQPAVFVTYTRPGDEARYAVVVAVRGGRSISVNFTLKPSDLQQDPDLVASVLASFEWV